MANVYMSFLGTNDYVECNYGHGGNIVRNVRFVQEATLKLFCGNWEEGDRARIFTTSDAFAKNWSDDGHKDFKTGRPFERQGLKSRIESLRLNFSVSNIHIPEGGSEEEIWEIFRIVFNDLNEGDVVVFDITHAFRSIPMLAIVILNYAKVLKKTRIVGIYYGAFEVLGNAFEARQKPIDVRTAPVLDLTPLDLLLEWTFAIDRFKEAGDGKAVSRLSLEAVTPFLKNSKGQDRFAKNIQLTAKALEEFTKSMTTCRALSIGTAARNLKEILDETSAEKRVKPLQPLLALLKEDVEPFSDDWAGNGFQAVKWCVKHNLIQQAFTILREIVVTRFVQMAGFDPENRDERELFSQIANIFSRKRRIEEASRRPPPEAGGLPPFLRRGLGSVRNIPADSRLPQRHQSRGDKAQAP
jgi:CRISPR-associated DxTHG motif protein